MMAMAIANGMAVALASPRSIPLTGWSTTKFMKRGMSNGLSGKEIPAFWFGRQCRIVTAIAAGGAGASGESSGNGGAVHWREGVAEDSCLLGSLQEKSMFSVLSNLEDYSLGRQGEKLEGIVAGIIGGVLLLFFAFASVDPSAAAEISSGLKPYYGTAASASSYGGYGGNSNKQTTAEYTFVVPETWKEKTITKIEKGTNGTDAEFNNPKHKDEKVYVTFLSNFRVLAPIDKVLSNLALSDPVLQDIISYADGIKSNDRKDDKGQLYYDYEIDSPVANVLVSVTCAKNKLYAHFVKAGPSDWARDQPMLRRLHESFQTIGAAPLGY